MKKEIKKKGKYNLQITFPFSFILFAIMLQLQELQKHIFCLLFLL